MYSVIANNKEVLSSVTQYDANCYAGKMLDNGIDAKVFVRDDDSGYEYPATPSNCYMLTYSFRNKGGVKWYNNEEQAVRMADLMYHFGGFANINHGVYEYHPHDKSWENIAY